MLNFIKTCDRLFYTFGAEQVAIHNELDRVQANAVKNGMEFSESLDVKPSTTDARWISSTVAKNGTVRMSVSAKKLGYVYPAGFVAPSWKLLHSLIESFKTGTPNFTATLRDNRYPGFINLTDEYTAFKYQLIPLDFSLKSPEYSIGYSQKRLLVQLPNAPEVLITKENFDKISRIASCLSVDKLTLVIAEGKLFAKFGLESASANTAIHCLGEIQAPDATIGIFKLDLILGLRRAFGEDVGIRIKQNALYAGFENDDYVGNVCLIGSK